MLNLNRLAVLVLVTVGHNVMGLVHPPMAERAAPITLGVAATFGISAATTITNGGLSKITGACGVCPGSAVTGFPPGICSGPTSLNTAPACAAGVACLSAFNTATAMVATKALSSANLNGMNLAPGVYTFPSSGVTNTGTLTLNGATNPSGQWIFKVTTTLTTSALSQVLLTNGALASNVFFIVGSSATLGATSSLEGNLIAHTSISFGGAAKVTGTVCALTGAVTLSDNAITIA